jgi:hypothetical protein
MSRGSARHWLATGSPPGSAPAPWARSIAPKLDVHGFHRRSAKCDGDHERLTWRDRIGIGGHRLDVAGNADEQIASNAGIAIFRAR